MLLKYDMGISMLTITIFLIFLADVVCY